MASLADRLAGRTDEILEAWADDARRTAPARGLDPAELRSVVPAWLATLSRLDAPGREQRQGLVDAHLAARARQGYTCAEVVDELCLLGQVVAAVLQGAGQPAGDPELRQVLDELRRGARHAIAVFTRDLPGEQQAARRDALRLRALAREPGRTDDEAPGLRDRLGEIVALAMEAVRADGGALLLDEDGRGLATAAGVGALRRTVEHPEPAEPAFAGHVSTAPAGVAVVRDVETSSWRFNPAVLEGGTHALLAARLPAHGPLAGLLCVGRQADPFTTREVVRFALLADDVALALEADRARHGLLREARERAAEREQRDTFVSLLAHDLRSPLSTARVAAHLLAREPGEPAERRAIAGRVLRGIEQTDRMVRDLLDANRIRAGKPLTLTLRPVDLVEVVRAAVVALIDQHGDVFRIEGDDRLAGIWSPRDLRRIAENLGANAAKHGARGAPVTFTVARGGLGAVLSVHNEGPAIPPERRATLFQPFARAPSPEGPRRPGWGLGLTLVKGSTEAHGGTVSVESEPGRGTTFRVELPLDARPFQAGAEGEAEGPAAAPEPSLAGVPEALAAEARALSNELSPACLLDRDLVIRFVNSAWDRFAWENGGAPAALGERVRGTPWLDHVAGERLRQHYAALLLGALEGPRWPGIVRLTECNSDEKARLVLSRFEPIARPGSGEPAGLAIRHLTLLDAPASAAGGPETDDSAYRAGAPVEQCSCCRCVRGPRGWVFVPGLVRRPPDVVLHGVCGPCARAYSAGGPLLDGGA